MADRRRKIGGFIASMMFLGIAVTGVAAGTTVNGTLADGNSDAMRLLMTTSSKMFTKDTCVESVRTGRSRESGYPASFPPEDFVPPGAEEWCACLEADPSGIASLSDRDFSTEAGREPFEQAFDRCRESVLDGSDFHTVDICRGMIGLFGFDLNTYYATFCGRICRSLENDKFEETYSYGPELSNLSSGCFAKCSRSTMPGYCQKYKVTYSEWQEIHGYVYTTNVRFIRVGYSSVGHQRHGFFGEENTRRIAENLCNALYPLLGGNKNECCNYARTFRALEHCCALDADGFSVFDCKKNFPTANIHYICKTQAKFGGFSRNGPSYCHYVGNREDFNNLKIWKQSTTGHYLFSLPAFFHSDFCGYNNPDGSPYCCTDLQIMNISADCANPETLTYVGRTTESLVGPTPGATEETEEEDPCLGMCEDGRECVVNSKGSSFCVDCTAFLKPKKSGDLAECCTYSAEDRKCVMALRGTPPGICRRSQEIFLLSDDGSRQSAQFTRSGGSACASPRDFRKNGAACRVVERRSGKVRCVE